MNSLRDGTYLGEDFKGGFMKTPIATTLALGLWILVTFLMVAEAVR